MAIINVPVLLFSSFAFEVSLNQSLLISLLSIVLLGSIISLGDRTSEPLGAIALDRLLHGAYSITRAWYRTGSQLERHQGLPTGEIHEDEP